MSKSEKNKPGFVVIISFVAIFLMIVVYIILAMFFPELLAKMNIGQDQPIKGN